jgi:MFS family permease
MEGSINVRANVNKELYLVIGFTFVYFTGLMMFQPILPLYIIDVGASKFELGILMAVFPGITILTRLPFGFIADRIGKWITLLISLLMQLTAFFLYSITPSPIYLYPITIIYALSFASFGPISIAMALDSAPMSKRGLAMGRYYTSIGSSMILGPLLTGLLALTFNYKQILFFATLLPMLCITIFFTIYLRNKIEIKTKKEIPLVKKEFFPLSALFKIFRSRNIFIICYAQITFFIATGFFGTLFPIYAKETLLYTTATISILFAIRGLPNALVRIPIGTLSDKIGRQKPLIFGYSLTFFALFLIPFISDIIIIAILMAVYGVAWGIRTAPTAAFMGDNVKSTDINLASALIWLTSDIGLALGSFIGGSSATIMGIPTILKIASLSVFSAIIVLFFIKEN